RRSRDSLLRRDPPRDRPRAPHRGGVRCLGVRRAASAGGRPRRRRAPARAAVGRRPPSSARKRVPLGRLIPCMAVTPGATILLADDEPSIRSLMVTALSAEGYRVLPAKNGFEALDVFDKQSHEIDLVITDMCMPYIGGRELIAAL